MKRAIWTAALALVAGAAQADPLKEAATLECEVKQASAIGEDGMRQENPAHLATPGEVFTVDTATGQITGVWVQTLSDETVVVMQPAETNNFVAWSAGPRKTNSEGIDFRNITIFAVDFSFGYDGVAPFTHSFNGSNVLTGLCRAAG